MDSSDLVKKAAVGLGAAMLGSYLLYKMVVKTESKIKICENTKIQYEEITGPGYAGYGRVFRFTCGPLTCIFCSYGAACLSVKYFGEEITLNRDPVEEPGAFFDDSKNSYYGVTCGRVGGRIHNANVALPNGQNFKVNANENLNLLHGGKENFSKVDWPNV